MQSNQSSRTIFLNPSFGNVHINPNVFKPKIASSVHVNPMFLQQLQRSEYNHGTATVHNVCQPVARIVQKSQMKIIRKTIPTNDVNTIKKNGLVKISRTKLVRASSFMDNKNLQLPLKNTSGKLRKMHGKYKIDRRSSRKRDIAAQQFKKKEFVSKYALRRVSLSENLLSTKMVITNKKLLKIGTSDHGKKFPSASTSANKKLELLNINGVLYRSTKNKLQKADTAQKILPSTASKSQIKGRAVFIKGDEFILDKSGKSLTRVAARKIANMTMKRIDIGGLTYMAQSNNVFVRTEVHKTRNHLSVAKQKSINTLFKNLVKTNIPCPIFRKLGKCAAFERGKCPKVHDRKQVVICSKFLKGECSIDKCLLSHNVTLAKMPTCKFFLQGVCVRENCAYLHKKLSGDTKICLEFLRGFCKLAEKCNKRHEFVCPEVERTGKCEKVKCSYCTRKTSLAGGHLKEGNDEVNIQEVVEGSGNDHNSEKLSASRYFIDESAALLENQIEEILEKKVILPSFEGAENPLQVITRPKLGELPAFIPL